ncbi:MAG: YheC/YheD family protein [Syntrophomonadaceae bacterium]|nr:YheC/YheD family protein [Syntrophomonadaceae bacterium]
MNITGKIILTRPMLDKLSVPMQAYIRVRVGNTVVTSQLEVSNKDNYSYSLSTSLAKALYIKKRPLRIRYDEKFNTIHLGPTIGILSTSLPNRTNYDPKSTNAELIYLSDIGKKIDGNVFLFTPNCVNFNNNTIKGYIYNHNPGRGVWVPAIYPIPDVIYDRISSRKSELKHNQIRQELMYMPYVKYFNPSFLNKWDVHQILTTENELSSNLPDTKELTKNNLQYMLELYKVVFVKPSNGSLGQGIIRVLKTKQNKLNYTIYRNNRIRRQADNVDEFFKNTTKTRGDKHYIVQQGLDLASYKGAPFDLRIIYQKNGKGEWVISKKFVRVAAKGSNISNLSIGGKAEVSRKVFRYLFKTTDLITVKNEEINLLCNKIANTLEQTCNQIYGELGLDIGIDKNGNPWLIEVNSKPRKTTETDFSMTIVRNTFIRPLEYASYLAGFPINN